MWKYHITSIMAKLNEALGTLEKPFFLLNNGGNSDCVFVIGEKATAVARYCVLLGQ